jgi:hypothetical protein
MSDPIHSNSLGDDEARPNKTKLKTRETRIPGCFKPTIRNVIRSTVCPQHYEATFADSTPKALEGARIPNERKST